MSEAGHTPTNIDAALLTTSFPDRRWSCLIRSAKGENLFTAWGLTKEEAETNAKTLLDLFNMEVGAIGIETGMTPRQLADTRQQYFEMLQAAQKENITLTSQRNKLLEALNTISEFGEAEGSPYALSVAKTARNAITKAQQEGQIT